MKKTIHVENGLENAPRPIYLLGDAQYEVVEGDHILIAKAHFPTSRDSINDRIKRHQIPHVNVVDAFFGVWNGAYLICNEEGYHGTLSSKGEYEAFMPIPADKEIGLELIIRNLEEIKKGRFDVKVDFDATYKHNSRTLMHLSGQGCAIKK